MQQVSNILKKSRIHGSNRLMSYYRIKVKREKWYKVRRKRIRYKMRSNKNRFLPLSYVTIRYVRLRGLARIGIYNRLYWKSMYPGINVTKIRFDRGYKLREKCSNGESILWKVESRLDVLIWRSGMVGSVLESKQLVRSGKVELYDGLTWSVAKRSDQRLTPWMVIKLTEWDIMKDALKAKWTSNRYKHKVPNYMLVNYTNGMIVMRHKPKDGEVLVPSHLPIRVASLMKQG